MELIGSLFLTLAVALLVAIFVMRPFFTRRAAAAPGGEAAEKLRDHQRSALLAERDRVLIALQELDFDHTMGKVPEEDYTEQRALLLRTGASALRRLDVLAAAAAGPAAGDSVEERIEAAVAARRGDGQHAVPAGSSAPVGSSVPVETGAPVGTGVPVGTGAPVVTAPVNGGNAKDELEALIASRKRQRKESAAGFCPRCGRPVQKSDKFCSRCGTTL